MANKNPTVTEPVAADVAAITLIIEEGVVTSIETAIAVKTSDASTIYRPAAASSKSDPKDYTQAVKDGLELIAAEAAAKFATAEGF